jgi:uncharacterized protein (TIGR02001 family)
MKKILLTSALITSLLTQVSVAEIKLGNAGTLSGSVGVSSQYIFRGFDQNRDKPAVSASLEWQTPTLGPIQPYLGVWGSQVGLDYRASSSAGASYEVDYMAGIRTSIQKLNIDLGYTLFTYEGGKQERILQQAEYGVKLSLPATKELTLNANYFLSDTNGIEISSRKNIADETLEAGFSYDLGVAKFVFLYQDWHKQSEVYNLSLQKNISGIDAELKYVDVNYDTLNTGFTKEEHVVFSLSKSF